MLLGLGFTLIVTIGLAAWARWLGRLYGVPLFVRYLVWFFVVVWALGAAGSMWTMVNTFGAVAGESVDASQKARILAAGIAEAMNLYAFSAGALLLAAIAMLFLTWRYRWSAKPPDVPRDPPYR